MVHRPGVQPVSGHQISDELSFESERFTRVVRRLVAKNQFLWFGAVDLPTKTRERIIPGWQLHGVIDKILF